MDNPNVPMLFPYAPDDFWKELREIIKEELKLLENKTIAANRFDTPGLTYKPLYKMDEVCEMFSITAPTIYDWIKHGKLQPLKVRSRVYFLHNDIQQLLKG